MLSLNISSTIFLWILIISLMYWSFVFWILYYFLPVYALIWMEYILQMSLEIGCMGNDFLRPRMSDNAYSVSFVVVSNWDSLTKLEQCIRIHVPHIPRYVWPQEICVWDLGATVKSSHSTLCQCRVSGAIAAHTPCHLFPGSPCSCGVAARSAAPPAPTWSLQLLRVLGQVHVQMLPEITGTNIFCRLSVSRLEAVRDSEGSSFSLVLLCFMSIFSS